jgi:phosphatidylglycerol lysyltransferase
MKILVRWLKRLLPLVLFGFALWLLRRELAHLHLRQVLDFVAALPASRLVAAFGFTILGYLALAGYDLIAFRSAGLSLPLWKVGFSSFTGYAFSNALGHPLFTGTALRMRLYTGWGLSTLEVARVLGLSLVTFWLGFLTLTGGALLLEPLALPAALPFAGAHGHLLGSLLLLLVAAYLAACWRFRAPLQVRGISFELPRPAFALAQIVISSLDWTFSAAVLYSLLPESWAITFPAFLAAYLLAQVGALASQVPGGLGVFETLMVLLLPKSLPRADILGALVAFRALYYLLPIGIAATMLAVFEALRRRVRIGRAAQTFGQWAPRFGPHLFALTTFSAGAVLLLSGATPAVRDRLDLLDRLIPLPIIELSHFAGSLFGVALLFLAVGLQRRLAEAYHLARAALAAGIVASLLKGLDWEEAAILALFLAALTPCRRYFYRRASLTREPFSPGWLAAILVVLGGSLWLGLFAYKHVEYGSELWWRFSLEANAPRFLRASVGALALGVAVALNHLLRPAPAEPRLPGEDEISQAAAIAAGAARGDAHLALVGDKELLFSEARTAYIMYAVQGKSWVAMGDPVGPEADRIELAWRFRELAQRQGGWTVFYQVSQENLPLYIDLGLSFVKLGEEARVPLAGFDLATPARKKLRYAVRKLEEAGCRFEVVEASQVPALLPRLQAISDDWLETKKVREKGFSLGFFDPGYLARTPVALVYQRGQGGEESVQGERTDRDDRIVAFANLWPGSPDGELSIDLMRHSQDAPGGVMDYLFARLMVWGRERGYAWFNLGMAPFSGLEPRELAPLAAKLGAYLFRHGESFYNFQGLRQYKEKFDPAWEPRYLASPGRLALPRVLADLALLISRGVKGTFGK